MNDDTLQTDSGSKFHSYDHKDFCLVWFQVLSLACCMAFVSQTMNCITSCHHVIYDNQMTSYVSCY